LLTGAASLTWLSLVGCDRNKKSVVTPQHQSADQVTAMNPNDYPLSSVLRKDFALDKLDVVIPKGEFDRDSIKSSKSSSARTGYGREFRDSYELFDSHQMLHCRISRSMNYDGRQIHISFNFYRDAPTNVIKSYQGNLYLVGDEKNYKLLIWLYKILNVSGGPGGRFPGLHPISYLNDDKDGTGVTLSTVARYLASYPTSGFWEDDEPERDYLLVYARGAENSPEYR
jgi:hypothetical protein